MDAQMDAAIKKTEIYMELNHNKKEILTRQETWGPFNSIRSVKTVGRRVSYHTYKVLYCMNVMWTRAWDQNDIQKASYIWFKERDNKYQWYRCRVDKLLENPDRGRCDVDIMDIEKQYSDNVWKPLIPR